MADSDYEKALARRRELLVELDILNDFIEAYEKLRGLRPVETSPVTVGGSSDTSGRRGRPRNSATPSEIAELARTILIEHGEPMTRSQLAEAIESRGVALVAKDKAKNVGTILWRYRDQFLNVPGQGYWPKDAPNEELGYHPQMGE